MPVSFDRIVKGHHYSRNQLAELWGYASYHALARGVVTPRGENKIILFVTEDKQGSHEPYADRLVGDTLEWEGPTDHFAEDRMAASGRTGEQIHVFYRARHHSDFTYLGRATVVAYTRRTQMPSQFVLECGRR